MKKSLFIFLALSLSISLTAQEKVKQQEVGLVFSGLSSFGFTYRLGTHKSLWRFQTLIINGTNTKSTNEEQNYNQTNNGFGLAIGKEFRNNITEQLEFRYGVDLAFNYSKSKEDTEYENFPNQDRMVERTSYQPGIKLIIGLNYVFMDKLVVGVEMLPNIYYLSEKTKAKVGSGDEVITDTSGFNYRIASTSVLLSLAYRF